MARPHDSVRAVARRPSDSRRRLSDVWSAQRDVWWRQFVFTWTIRRFSLWRSLTQPVYQLEGFSSLRAGRACDRSGAGRWARR
jgi:hypothetical protein